MPRHKSKKRRKYRTSSSSAFSNSSSLSSHKRSKRSKWSRHSHKKRRRPSASSASSSSLNSMKDYGRYKRRRHSSPQVVDVQSTVQPVRNIEETPNIHSHNVLQQISKESGSEPETEAWSFDKAINEVFRLLPEELCLKPLEDHTPNKPLSGIKQLMESPATPLLVLPQSELMKT